MLCKQAIKINLDEMFIKLLHIVFTRMKSFIVYYIDGRISKRSKYLCCIVLQKELWIKLLLIFFSRCGVSAPSCVKKDGSFLVHYSLEDLLQWKLESVNSKKFCKIHCINSSIKSKGKLAALANFKN